MWAVKVPWRSRGKVGINLITDLCRWRWDFMAQNYRAEEICHENLVENYETLGAINCVVEKVNFLSVAIDAEMEKGKSNQRSKGSLEIVNSNSSTTNYFCLMDRLMALLLRARK